MTVDVIQARDNGNSIQEFLEEEWIHWQTEWIWWCEGGGGDCVNP